MTNLRIESIVPLPGNTGFAVVFNLPLESGIVNGFGRVQGYHYRSSPPRIRFAVRFNEQEDPCMLRFCCDCANDQLVQDELLALLKEFKLVSPALTELTPAAGTHLPITDTQPRA